MKKKANKSFQVSFFRGKIGIVYLSEKLGESIYIEDVWGESGIQGHATF